MMDNVHYAEPIATLIRQGITRSQIAAECGVTRTIIQRLAKGLPVRRYNLEKIEVGINKLLQDRPSLGRLDYLEIK